MATCRCAFAQPPAEMIDAENTTTISTEEEFCCDMCEQMRAVEGRTQFHNGTICQQCKEDLDDWLDEDRLTRQTADMVDEDADENEIPAGLFHCIGCDSLRDTDHGEYINDDLICGACYQKLAEECA